jgi:ligand-binding SRPBCC domain-containing protein
MPIFERSIEIDAPIKSVYDFHLDTRNAARIASEGQEFVSITGDFQIGRASCRERVCQYV